MALWDNITGWITDIDVMGITLDRYLLAFVAVLAAVILRRVFSSIIIRFLRRFTARTKTDLDDMLLTAIEQPLGFLFIVAGFYASILLLQPPSEPVDVNKFAFGVLGVLLIIGLTWLVFRLIDALSAHFAAVAGRTRSKIDDQLVPIIRKSLKIFFGILAFIFAIQNLGYSVGSLLAGLGIGGLALALAAKDTLSNFFGSITILLDRPFAVGDWIEMNGQEGVVEEVGFRSTRIRTFGKSQLSIPNSILANNVINNWSRMPIRRVKMTVGVTYKSSAAQMEQAVEGIKGLLKRHPEVYQDFYLINFTDFGASSLDIFVYYFTTTTVWAEYLRIRQEINIGIMRLLEDLGMSVAFPTRTIYIEDEAKETAALPARDTTPPSSAS